MRTLVGSVTPSDDGLPTGSYPWPDTGAWTRVLMLRTLDGGVAGADGRSGSVSDPTDREVLEEVRRLADAVVLGAETMRAERYGPMLARPEAAEERRRLGLAPAPRLVIVSGRLHLPWDEPVFSESALPPLVATGTSADPAARRLAERHAEVLTLPSPRVSAQGLVDALHARGLRRLVCEGGPGLLADFARAGLVDEVDLTVAPRLPAYGPGAERGEYPVEPEGFVLTQLLEHRSFLFARYLRP